MKLDDLKRFDLLYVATPYSKYPAGTEAAFEAAAAITARLMQMGLKVFSPIAHSHPLAVHGDIDPLDHSIWLPFDRVMMAKADALLVVMMDGWEQSFGIQHEIEIFQKSLNPHFYLDPITMELAVPHGAGATLAADIANRAASIVAGERKRAYGDASEGLNRIAVIWNGILSAAGKTTDRPIDSFDVAQMMTGLKIARGYTGPYRIDNAIDQAGWSAIAGEVSAVARGGS